MSERYTNLTIEEHSFWGKTVSECDYSPSVELEEVTERNASGVLKSMELPKVWNHTDPPPTLAVEVIHEIAVEDCCRHCELYEGCIAFNYYYKKVDFGYPTPRHRINASAHEPLENYCVLLSNHRPKHYQSYPRKSNGNLMQMISGRTKGFWENRARTRYCFNPRRYGPGNKSKNQSSPSTECYNGGVCNEEFSSISVTNRNLRMGNKACSCPNNLLGPRCEHDTCSWDCSLIYDGSDVIEGGFVVDHPRECCALCWEHVACQVFTWYHSNYTEADKRSRCFLKKDWTYKPIRIKHQFEDSYEQRHGDCMLGKYRSPKQEKINFTISGAKTINCQDTYPSSIFKPYYGMENFCRSGKLTNKLNPPTSFDCWSWSFNIELTPTSMYKQNRENYSHCVCKNENVSSNVQYAGNLCEMVFIYKHSYFGTDWNSGLHDSFVAPLRISPNNMPG